MTYVYVVCKGEHGEGHGPVSAHAEYVAALSAYNDVIGARPILQRGHGRYLVELDGCDELWIYRMDIQSGAVAVPLPATEEPARTLTAVERRAEEYIAPVDAEEPWKDPNYEVTDAQWQAQIERDAESTEAGLS